jgi:hypothetical protein
MTDTATNDDDDVRQLREALSYDPHTGVLRWKTQRSNLRAGSVAGYVDQRGYRFIRFGPRLLLAHRIAWAIHYGSWPERDIDHRNTDKGDNSIDNLRLASRPQNNANAPSRTALPKGCYRLKGRERWYSQIKVNGRNVRLGTFATSEAAAAAFMRAHQAAHGEFSRCEAR